MDCWCFTSNGLDQSLVECQVYVARVHSTVDVAAATQRWPPPNCTDLVRNLHALRSLLERMAGLRQFVEEKQRENGQDHFFTIFT